jgi:hypothetical protein
MEPKTVLSNPRQMNNHPKNLYPTTFRFQNWDAETNNKHLQLEASEDNAEASEKCCNIPKR